MSFPNPLDDVARRWGRTNAVAVVIAVAVGVALLTPEGSRLAWVVVVAGVILAATADEFSTTPPSEIDETKRLYVEGEITLAEFEDRAGLILDERAQEIRDVVEQVAGVGPATSASIAQEFGSVDELRLASTDDLTSIYGIGSSTADAIVDEIGSDVEAIAASNQAARDDAVATDGGSA